MRDQIKKRLAELKNGSKAGHARLAKLDSEAAQLREIA